MILSCKTWTNLPHTNLRRNDACWFSERFKINKQHEYEVSKTSPPRTRFKTSKLIRESLCRCMDRWMPVRCLNLGSSGGDYDILRFSLQKSRLGPLGPRTHLCSSIAFCLSTSGFYLGFACGSVWAYADGFSTVFRDCFVLLINYFRHIRTIVNISGLSCPCRTSWSLVLADASRIVQRYCVGCRWNLGSFLRWAESRPGGQTKHISLPQETNWTCLAALYNFFILIY